MLAAAENLQQVEGALHDSGGTIEASVESVRSRQGFQLLVWDSMAASVVLPLLPTLALQLSGRGVAYCAVWTGLIVSAFSGARSLVLLGSRRRSLDPPLPSDIRYALVSLLLAAGHLLTGMVRVSRGTSGLGWFLLGRVMMGALAAASYLLGVGCSFSDNAKADQDWDPIKRDASPGMTGFLIGTALGGFFWNGGASRPLLWVGASAAFIHIIGAIVILSTAIQRRRHVQRGGVGSEVNYSALVSMEFPPTPQGFELELGRWENSTAAQPPPPRYLRGCGGDAAEAARRWQLTLQWREAEGVDRILAEPHPRFNLIKKHYPHYVHRRSRDGCPVYYDFPGRVQADKLEAEGIGLDDMTRHFTFMCEYMWHHIEPNDNAQCVTVLDLTGVTLRSISGGSALNFFKAASRITQDHYVERSNKLFIVNAPSYFSMLWRAVKPLLHANTLKKINVCPSGSHLQYLSDTIDPINIPPEMGGTCPLKLGESEEEEAMRQFVDKLNSTLSLPPSNQEEAPLSDESEDESSLGEMPRRQNIFSRMTASIRGMRKPRPTQAFLGDSNRYYYDADRHQWVLRQDSYTTLARQVADNDFMDSASASPGEEELTVLAIQAAQLAQSTTHEQSAQLQPEPEYLVPWLGKGGREAADFADSSCPSLASIWYGLLVATREVVPLWALLSTSQGGLGYTPLELAVSLELVGVGLWITRSVLAESVLSKSSMEKYGPHRIKAALLVHAGFVIPLTIFSPLAWGAGSVGIQITALGTVLVLCCNYVLLLLCRAARLAACRHSHKEGAAAWMDCKSLNVAEACGATLGPLMMGIILGTGLPYPFDASFWFLLCPALDLLLWGTVKPTVKVRRRGSHLAVGAARFL
jgi:hypothetical protein